MERQDKGQDIVLVASEPLTFERADWVTVPTNCTLTAPFAYLLAILTGTAILTINGQTVLLHPIVDEHHVADPLHIRKSGYAESKGQSGVVSAC
jgi:glutamine amidotransferase